MYESKDYKTDLSDFIEILKEQDFMEHSIEDVRNRWAYSISDWEEEYSQEEIQRAFDLFKGYAVKEMFDWFEGWADEVGLDEQRLNEVED